MKLLFDDQSGRIRKIVSNSAGTDGLAELPGYTGSMMVAETHYLTGGEGEWAVTGRPTLPAWPAQMPAPATLSMADLPTGTTVTATNEAGEAVATTDPADPITLTGAGDTYRVTVDAPWPWMPHEQTVEVV